MLRVNEDNGTTFRYDNNSSVSVPPISSYHSLFASSKNENRVRVSNDQRLWFGPLEQFAHWLRCRTLKAGQGCDSGVRQEASPRVAQATKWPLQSRYR